MAGKKKAGITIGQYRITPAGIALLILIIAAIVFAVILLTSGEIEETPKIVVETPEPVQITAVHTTAVPSATAVPTPTPAPRSATICVLGEVVVQDNVLAAAKQPDGNYDFSDMFTYIKEIVSGADYAIVDVDGSFGGTKEYTGGSALITPSSIADALVGCGADMFNLANDHALDGGFEDLQASMQHLDSIGADYVGAARSKEEHDTAKVVDINGIRVGFLAYTTSLNGLEAKADADTLAYGINYITKQTNPKADIAALKAAGAETVVAVMNWGDMLSTDVSDVQMKFAEYLSGLGVNVIIGYNPHVIQPAVTKTVGTDTVLCIFSPGNLLSDVRSQPGDSGVIYRFTLTENASRTGFTIENPEYIPTYVWRIDNGDGTYDYRTVPVGQYLERKPDDMDYTQYSRMGSIWAEAEIAMSGVGSKTAG